MDSSGKFVKELLSWNLLWVWIWANQPIHSFLVGCLNPCLQRTSVRVVLPNLWVRHMVTTNKIESMKANCDHCKLQLLPTLQCIIIGQDRVVVVVINASYPSLSLENRTTECEVHSSTTKTVVVYVYTPLQSTWSRSLLGVDFDNAGKYYSHFAFPIVMLLSIDFYSCNIWDSSGKDINASEARRLKQSIPSATVRYFPNCNGALLLVIIIPSSSCDVVWYSNGCDMLI